MEYHRQQLNKHCRVCGRYFRDLEKERGVRECIEHKGTLKTYLGLDIDSDDTNTHPRLICNKCFSTVRNMKEGKVTYTNLSPFKWSSHKDDSCTVRLYTCICTYMRLRISQVCAHFTSLKKPGRPPKKPKVLGRCRHGNRLSLLQHIKMLTPTVTTQTYMPSDHSPVNLSSIKCKKCTCILRQPLQLSCGALLCTSCLVKSIEMTDGDSVPCPACNEVLEPSSIHSAPDAIMEILNNLPVICERCNNMVKIQHLSHHTQTNMLELSTTSSLKP